MTETRLVFVPVVPEVEAVAPPAPVPFAARLAADFARLLADTEEAAR